MSEARVVRAARGSALSCKGWQQEAALRMLMNNLDPDVAERPDELVVYGGTGKAARNWACFDAIVRTLQRLENDETLLVQSGKPVGVFRTHEEAPRVLIANSHLVPRWATWDEFRRLEALGLTMYGQMTAGSWIYIGTQGILQGTYETFGACAERHFGGTLAGRLVVSGGLGGMGGAQPLAATMNGARLPRRRRGRSAHPEAPVERLPRPHGDQPRRGARAACSTAKAQPSALSVGLVGNIAEVLPELVGARPHARRAHGPDLRARSRVRLHPARAHAGRGRAAAQHGARGLSQRPCSTPWCSTWKRCSRSRSAAPSRSTTATTCAVRWPTSAGSRDAFEIPGFVPEYIRPLFCRGSGPFRWAALSGDPEDIARTDEAVLETFPEHARLARWIGKAREKVQLPGSAGAHLLARVRRARRARARASTGW